MREPIRTLFLAHRFPFFPVPPLQNALIWRWAVARLMYVMWEHEPEIIKAAHNIESDDEVRVRLHVGIALARYWQWLGYCLLGVIFDPCLSLFFFCVSILSVYFECIF